MSEAAGKHVFRTDRRTAVQVFGGQVQALGAAAGATAAALGAAAGWAAMNGALVMVNGALVLSDLARDYRAESAVAHTAGMTLSAYQTELRAEALPLFRAGLEARGLTFAEGGTLRLAQGEAALAFTAFDAQGRAVLFVRDNGGTVELLLSDDRALPLAEQVMAESIFALAEESLRQQGFQVARRGDQRRVLARQTADGGREQVIVDYHGGQLEAEAIAFDRAGQALHGDACPDMLDFTAYFRSPDFAALNGRRHAAGATGDRVRADAATFHGRREAGR